MNLRSKSLFPFVVYLKPKMTKHKNLTSTTDLLSPLSSDIDLSDFSTDDLDDDLKPTPKTKTRFSKSKFLITIRLQKCLQWNLCFTTTEFYDHLSFIVGIYNTNTTCCLEIDPCLNNDHLSFRTQIAETKWFP